MQTKNLTQQVEIPAAPHEVFEMLLDPERHSRFTGAHAAISRRVGSPFTAYDGWIEGVQMEVVKDRLIVQKWRGKDWPKGHYSIATFTLAPSGAGTRITLTQRGIPAGLFEGISAGWHEHYWDKMQKSLDIDRRLWGARSR
ncbi:MAG: SRPBCC domain-containing protein [Candidatus Aenigmarchaeota archaeon]|nr:SRPBCC domain-containing protein [Candidatus Aenigmarchaeota archaeon]